MRKKMLLVGEPMGLFIAKQKGKLSQVTEYSMTTAGAELNVAIGLKRLDHQVGYYTKLGKDPFGQLIEQAMKNDGISTELIGYSEERTTGFMLKSKVDKGDPEIFYYRKNSAASTLSTEDIESLDLSEYDAIHMTGITPALTKNTREATTKLSEKARQNKMMFSFDPNLRPQLWKSQDEMIEYMNEMASKCDIFLPGINEAKILLGISDPEKIAQKYLEMGTKVVIIKLGDKGAYYATNDDRGFVEGFKVEKIVDTVGAGDGFAAGVLSAIRENLSLKEAVRRGNAVGAIQVMSLGDNDGLPTVEELELFIKGDPNWRIRENH